jgi:hypothetical protein
MRTTQRIVLAASLLLTAACSQDSARVLGPGEPARSTWTRTYYFRGATYQGAHPFSAVPAAFSAGYVKVEMVPDNPLMGAYEMGRVDADGDLYGPFYKPADNSIRLTAVPTVSGCTFLGWIFGTSSSISTTQNPINMDSYKVYSQATGKFLCP